MNDLPLLEKIVAGKGHLKENPAPVRRTIYIATLALINAIIIGFLAKGLVLLINFVSNIFFFGEVSLHERSPAENSLGYWVIAMPVIGGLIVGLMARFGSKGIRGHGIPEAMEKIITNESRIHPVITILKPLSAAISIGSGGPFGAEGPIISTGGALGSFCGQTLHITAQERKFLLAAGATAGMTAIFGTPFAAILLAIELLLFEFSAKSFIPVMIACVTGACMHFFLFTTLPVFPMPETGQTDSSAVAAYAFMGLIIGLFSVGVTKAVYLIEDVFEKIPTHWMWWPAIGGVAVGVIGYFEPYTLGVGYQNITNVLSGQLTISVLFSLFFWKFLSWAIALGSGTSGGTLAPLLTIGSASGCVLGILGQQYFPEANISLPMAALVGMSALFAGSSRALLTSIVFAVETTMQESTLLPLIAGCVASYMVSFLLMRSTIMTEKIKRRGISLPDSYHPDLLQIKTVADVVVPVDDGEVYTVDQSVSVKDLRKWFRENGFYYSRNMLIVVNKEGTLMGTLSKLKLIENNVTEASKVYSIMDRETDFVYSESSLQMAVELMLKSGKDLLPVLDHATNNLVGIVSEKDILMIFRQRFHEENHHHRHISMKNKTLSMLRTSRDFLQKQRGPKPE